MEEAFYFSGEMGQIYAVMHAPAKASKHTAFLFCAPFGEEKLWSQLVCTNFARELSRRGHPVLRFDYRGTGDSDGHFEESSPDSYLSDIRHALNMLKQKAGAGRSVGLLGLRFGATLATLAAETAPEVKRLVLWSPVLRGAEYMQELLRVNLAMQMAIHKEVRVGREALIKAMRNGRHTNVDGYQITAEMYDQVSAIDLLLGDRLTSAQCLVVEVAARPMPVPGREICQLAARFRRGVAHASVEEPFWKEIRPLYARAERLFADTLNWLGHERHDL